MTQIRLSRYLKIIILGAAITGLIIYLWAIPEIGQSIAKQNPEFSHCYYPWLILLWATAIPCYCALFCCFKIAASLKSDKAFTAANGRLFKIIAVLALTDTSFFTLANLIFLFLNMNHPGIFLFSVLIMFAGIAIYVICSGLSQLVNKAAALQEQSDWTI